MAQNITELFGSLPDFVLQGFGPNEIFNIVRDGDPYPQALAPDTKGLPVFDDFYQGDPVSASDMVTSMIMQDISSAPPTPSDSMRMQGALRTANNLRNTGLMVDPGGNLSPPTPDPMYSANPTRVQEAIGREVAADYGMPEDEMVEILKKEEEQREKDNLLYGDEQPARKLQQDMEVADMANTMAQAEIAYDMPDPMSQRQAFEMSQGMAPSFETPAMYQQQFPVGGLRPSMSQEQLAKVDPISPEESLLQRYPALSPGMQDVIQRGLLTPGELTQGMPVEESETYPGGMSPSLQQALIDVYKERGGTDTLPMERDDLFRREFEGTESETLKQEEEDARKDFQGDQKAVAKVQGALGQTSTQQTGYKDIAESPIYNIEPAQLKNLINTAQPSLQDTGEGQWMFFGKVPGAPAYDGYFSPSENKVYAVEPETQIVRDLGTASLKQGKTESTISFGNRSISQPFGQTAWMPGTGTETPRPNVIGKGLVGGADVLDTFDNSYSGLRNFYKAARTQSMGENLRNPQKSQK